MNPAPAPTVLHTVDLFSGISGIGHGLRGLAVPVAYCDISPDCRRILEARMAAGDVPSAPVFADVRDVCAAALAARIPGFATDLDRDSRMLVAGFPCVGFSVMGQKRAFGDAQSSLFEHVLRILDSFAAEDRPPLVFLENVANVLRLGGARIVDELSVKRGYELRWCVVSAEDVGAPHVRRRWFCLAVRRGHRLRCAAEGPAPTPYAWTPDAMRTVSRMIPPSEPAETLADAKVRCQLLGNAVVPDAARRAFLYLFTGRVEADQGRVLDLAPSDVFLARRRAALPTKRDWPRCAIVLASSNEVVALPDLPPLRACVIDGPAMDPRAFAVDKAPSPLVRTPLLARLTRMPRWSTPRHGMTAACNLLTARSVRDLPTQVRFEVGTTPDTCRRGHLSPRFVEFLMGFPLDWTAVERDRRTPVDATVEGIHHGSS